MAETPANSPVTPVPPSNKVAINSGVVEVPHGFDVTVQIRALAIKPQMDKGLAAMTAAAVLVQRLVDNKEYGDIDNVLHLLKLFPPDMGTL